MIKSVCMDESESNLIGGRYKVFDTIDSGGMGIVYCCHDTKEDNVYALKTFKLYDDDLERITKNFKRESYA